MTCFNRVSGIRFPTLRQGLAAAGGALAMSAALAQPPATGAVAIIVAPADQQTMEAQRRESVFRAVDVNGDGYISAEEGARAGVGQDGFTRIDRNSDARIDRGEFVQIVIIEGAGGSAVGGTGTAAPGAEAGRGTTPPGGDAPTSGAGGRPPIK